MQGGEPSIQTHLQHQFASYLLMSHWPQQVSGPHLKFHHSLGGQAVPQDRLYNLMTAKVKKQKRVTQERDHAWFYVTENRPQQTRFKWLSSDREQERRRSVHKRQPQAMCPPARVRGPTADVAHTLCHAAAQGLISSSWGLKYRKLGHAWGPLMRTLKQNKAVRVKPGTESQSFPRPWPHYRLWELFVSQVMNYSKLKPILIWPNKCQKTVPRDCFSQHPTSWVRNPLQSSITLQGHMAEELWWIIQRTTESS